jgi:ABC-type amino acid transport substrate-binding protein
MPMKLPQLLLVILLSVTAAYATAFYFNARGAAPAVRESAFERVMRTKTIRCGYVVNPPYLLKDPNTGAMSGLAYEYVGAIAHELGLQVEWAEETGWGSFHEGLNGNRYDVMCVPVWQSGARAKIALLTIPLYYNSMYAFARTDDNRFDQNLDAANNPDIRVSVMDGDITQAIKQMRFPLAQEVAVTQINGSAEEFMNVATNKADIIFDIPEQLDRFNANATQRLKTAGGGQPVRLFGNVLAVKQGEFALKAMLDSTIESINTDGTAPQIVKKYGPAFRPIGPGYSTETPP